MIRELLGRVGVGWEASRPSSKTKKNILDNISGNQSKEKAPDLDERGLIRI